jgi:hypothetical protein
VQSDETPLFLWQSMQKSIVIRTNGACGGAVVASIAPWHVTQGRPAIFTCRRWE